MLLALLLVHSATAVLEEGGRVHNSLVVLLQRACLLRDVEPALRSGCDNRHSFFKTTIGIFWHAGLDSRDQSVKALGILKGNKKDRLKKHPKKQKTKQGLTKK